MRRAGVAASLLLCALLAGACSGLRPAPAGPHIDQSVQRLMSAAKVPGLAVALVEHGQLAYLKTYGLRDVESAAPLNPDTVMYGASLTKATFAYLVMQLVDDGRIDLDQSIAAYLPKPLPEYEKYSDLAGDERWRMITPRMLLSHTAGFPNFRFFTRDGVYRQDAKLSFWFEPGARFSYSGEGINLLQFVIEQGLGLDVGQLMQQRVFDRFGMRRSSTTWRDDFAADNATGYDEAGKALGHKRRGSTRAAGSMDTTPADYARFLAGLQRGEGISAASKKEMLRPQIEIDSVQQFPPQLTDSTTDNRGIALAYGLGWGLFRSSQGPAYFKEGHDDGTNNYVLCIENRQACLMLLSNSSNAEGIFKYLADDLLGPTCLPWFWQNYIPYDHPELREPSARDQHHLPCDEPG
ncbi:MAG: serine hydrolase [Hydrocarboniphaga sp.]|uniref:serine hydrolase domain-containing protein n=1 Tax=Hydrocarboniphaga sp. TaxID=2033016 RepID=UPI00260A3E4E|nr:serine hydrolase domain-containing protein [Hydrocarboniphaga sp.]MDB5973032.1 serine hydrolase [Hydrocarboniphaga sp.]